MAPVELAGRRFDRQAAKGRGSRVRIYLNGVRAVSHRPHPDKPFSGRLMLRLSSELHRHIYVAARRDGKSINQWIADRLEQPTAS